MTQIQIQRQGRVAPCEQRLQTELELLNDIKASEPDQYYPSLRKLALKNYWLYLRVVLSYSWMDPWFHGEEIVKFVEENWGDAMLILLPRDSGKSGCITVPMPAFWLAQDPFNSALVCNAAEDRAAKMARAAAGIITNNESYQKAFPYVVPSSKWGEGGYYLDTTKVKKGSYGSVERIDAGIGSFGVRGNITGSHISGGMILDDLINEKMAKFALELARAESFAVEAITCLNPDRPLFVIGTRWTYNDFYGRILDGEILGPKGRFKILKLGYKRTNSDGQEELVWPQKTYVDLQGKVQKAGYTWDYIDAQKKNRGRLFSALFENEPVTASDRHFDCAKLQEKLFTKVPFEYGVVQNVCIEVEAQASALISTLQMLMREQGRAMKIEAIRAGKRAKEERIKAWLGPLVDEYKLNMRADLWHSERNLGQEFRTFPKGYDDCIDACAYLSQVCQDAPEGTPPGISIVCDPAFTENADSDYTSIIAGCKFNGELWVLDCERFQTEKAEVLIRMLFSMYDRFNVGFRRKKSTKTPILGFDPRRVGARSSRSSWADSGFDVDTSLLFKDTKK